MDHTIMEYPSVCCRVAEYVAAEYTHNKQNEAMMRGLEAIGLKAGTMPR